ncbi:TetR/AcrR family transcriptional regulator [Microbacterium rhizophilus]|uniref:TetR/AcrR family transcriptional regulator n=1 Tax=Microbacterium rhizophilus TaxID=3138934 RepID=UPI0031E5396D
MAGPKDHGRDRTPGRRRASHSMEAVLSEAVALLDEAGEQALTFRALAQRLGGGVGSIYWYVASKDELLDRATDHALVAVLDATEPFAQDDAAGDPIDSIRATAWVLFDAIVDRPWLTAYFMRDTDIQPNALRMYERIGEQVMRLGLTARQTFHAVSAILGFVIGIASDLSQQPPAVVADGTVGPDEYMAAFAERWRQTDPQEFPFVHHIVDEFAHHDDTDQFRAGLDLLLDGLRLQAQGG